MKKQREIKFRAWDRKERKMYYNDSNFQERDDYNDNWESELLCIRSINELSKNNNIILMQYVGIRDVNGKEIYEGDILDDETFIACNLFYNNLGTVDLPLQEQWIEITTDLEKREIIGNIYKNPELLKR